MKKIQYEDINPDYEIAKYPIDNRIVVKYKK